MAPLTPPPTQRNRTPSPHEYVHPRKPDTAAILSKGSVSSLDASLCRDELGETLGESGLCVTALDVLLQPVEVSDTAARHAARTRALAQRKQDAEFGDLESPRTLRGSERDIDRCEGRTGRSHRLLRGTLEGLLADIALDRLGRLDLRQLGDRD
jgi:hypothetical protein